MFTPYNVLCHPPIGSTTIQEDITAVEQGEIRRILLCGPPVAGKTTFSQWLSYQVRSVSLIVNEIFDDVSFATRSHTSARYLEFESHRYQFWEKVSQEITATLLERHIPQGTCEIIPLPAFGKYDTGKSTVTHFASLIRQGVISDTRVLVITSPDRISWKKQTEKRRMMYRLIMEYRLRQVTEKEFLSSLARIIPIPVSFSADAFVRSYAKMLPPDQVVRAYSDHTVAVGKFTSDHLYDRAWARITREIRIPSHLQEEGVPLVYSQMYRIYAAHMVYWIYETLGLSPGVAKVIANPYIG